MKKILITGANSYIGVSFEKYMSQWPEQYQVDTVDLVDGSWREKSFSDYDCVYHVAGIAHMKETEENAHLYDEVNRDLAIETARKAKKDGVTQFLFMSSMSVYGMDQGTITPQTQPSPQSRYGKSKLEAEEGLTALCDEHFTVAILRPPMVYGRDCRGNFQLLRKLALKSPIFPVVNNQRSMISVLNLCAFVRLMVDRGCGGVFFPQNRDYVNTTDMARVMAKSRQRGLWFSRLAGLGVKMLMPLSSKARKAFSTLIYQDCEQFDFCYCVEDMETSVRNSL